MPPNATRKAQDERKRLLVEFVALDQPNVNAEEIAAGLRWEIRADREPPNVAIFRRGKDRKLVANVSQTGKYASLYPSWEPVIAEWRKQRETKQRTKHKDVGSGKFDV